MPAQNLNKPQPTLLQRLADPGVYARSNRSGVFTTGEVEEALAMLDLVPVLDMLGKWRELDRDTTRHPGGRKTQTQHDRAVIAGWVLLATEDAPFLISELANLLWRRLTPEGRALLGIGHLEVGDHHAAEAELWYGRANAWTRRVFKVIDPEPMPRRLGNVAERRYAASNVDPEVAAVRDARLEWFNNQLIEMTLRALPAEVLAGWAGDVSVDQTKVPSVSKRGRSRWQKKNGKRIGPEPEAIMLMSQRMDWYMHKPEYRNGDDPNKRDGTWGAAANIAVMAQQNPRDAPKHPLLAVAYNLGTPNNDQISEETIRLLASLQDRGHPAGHVVGDKEYAALQAPERYALPLRALGYDIVTDYRSNLLGVRGQVGGALQIEGRFYCPAIPTALRDASINHHKAAASAKTEAELEAIDEKYAKAVEHGRPLYEVRVKERPDQNGNYPIVCPALGPAAKVDCPLRKPHPSASKKIRPLVNPPAEDRQDRICRNSSVTVPFGPEIRYSQRFRYGGRDWRTHYGHGRSQSEGYNAILKSPTGGDLENTGRRRGRSWVNAAVAVAFTIVAANLRMTKAWYRAEAKRLANPNQPYIRDTRPFGAIGIAKYKARLPEMDETGAVINRSGQVAS